MGLIYTPRVSSPLPPVSGSLVCALETVLAERSGFQRRQAQSSARPGSLTGLSFRDKVLESGPPRASTVPRRVAWVEPRARVPSARAPRVLVVAADTQVRLAVARELAPRFELLHAMDFTSAARKLEAGESFSALVIDLGLSDSRGASWFLARLVDHAFEGPRILLSGAIRREHASSLCQSCVTHFALARPWRGGELRALVESALGLPVARASARDM